MKKGKVRALLASALVLSCTSAGLPADASAASRSCGVTKNFYEQKVEVIVARGSISCSSARSVVRRAGLGQGDPAPRGWNCWRAFGLDLKKWVGGCERGRVTVMMRRR